MSTNDTLTALIEAHRDMALGRARWIARFFLAQYDYAPLPDINQEALIGIYQAITTYDSTKSQLRTWIQRCVQHRVQEYIRQETRPAAHSCESLEQHLQIHGDLADPGPALDRQVLTHALHAALTHLPQFEQTLLELRYGDNYRSRQSCARTLGLSYKEFTAREQQALQRLGHILQEYGNE